MSPFIEILTELELDAHLKNSSPTVIHLLYFYTHWTEFQSPLKSDLQALIAQPPLPKSPIKSCLSINGKDLVEIAQRYSVRKAPAIVWLRGTDILQTISGLNRNAIQDSFRIHTDLAVQLPTDKSNETDQPTMDQETKVAVFERLSNLVKSAPFMLFMKGTPKKPYCRFSRRMVNLLEQNNIEFESFNILEDENIRKGLKLFRNWPTFPQLWANGELVGGLDVVREEITANPEYLKQVQMVIPCARLAGTNVI